MHVFVQGAFIIKQAGLTRMKYNKCFIEMGELDTIELEPILEPHLYLVNAYFAPPEWTFAMFIMAFACLVAACNRRNPDPNAVIVAEPVDKV